MIYGSTNHPVLIKKIKLKIWSLRKELEAVVEDKLISKNSEVLTDKEQEVIRDQYHATPSEKSEESTLTLAPDEEAAESEENKDNEKELEAKTEEDSEIDEASESEEATQGEEEQVIAGPKSISQTIPILDKAEVATGRTILGEVLMDKMYFFSSKSYLIGQSVVVDFQVPNRFVVNAQVFHSRIHNMKGRIISEQSMPYRIGVLFTFIKEGERTILREFIKSIEPVLPKAGAKVKAKEEVATDEFDELDNLDL